MSGFGICTATRWATRRVQKKWDRLPEGEKILALAAIPKYRRFYESKHIELAYPETYIDQRRWENEYN